MHLVAVEKPVGVARVNPGDIIQKLIDRINAHTYLEIGVYRGSTFLRIKAKRKIAVDPQLRISISKKVKWIVRNLCNITAQYHHMTSDEFFANWNSDNSLDVVFIDGLHTFQQVLKDVDNSLKHLGENGVIVLHDCNPPHKAAAHPAESFEYVKSLNLAGWDGGWCGDVWKAICHIRARRKNLKTFVVDCDVGIGIVTKGEPDSVLELTDQELENLTFDDLERNRKDVLNLKTLAYFEDFLKLL